MYRGVINLDYTGAEPNAFGKLRVALIDLGWVRVETSAYVIDSGDLHPIWKGIELVAKQSASIGDLSTLTYHIQLWDPAETQHGTLKKYHPNAVADIEQKPFP
jgi:hypothetical protein